MSADHRSGAAGQTILRNIVALSILRFTNVVVPLMTVPYLVRVLGPERFGLIAFAQALVRYFQVVTDYGFNLSATRRISISRTDGARRSEIFSAVMLIQGTLMLACLIVLTVLVATIERFAAERAVYLLTFGMVVGHVLFPVWFFQGMERMGSITVLNFVAKMIFALSVFIFVRDEPDYVLVPLLYSAGFVFAGVLSQVLVRRCFATALALPSWSLVRRELEEGWHAFISTVAISLYTTGNTFLLGLVAGDLVVGYYAAAEKLIRALQEMVAPVSQALYPHISKLATTSHEQAARFFRRTAVVMSTTGLALSVVVFLLAGPVVRLVLGSQYEPSIAVLRILGLVPVMVAISNVFAVQGLFAFGHHRIVSKFVGLCAIVYLPVAIGLMWRLEHVGAAIAASAVEAAIAVLSVYYFGKKVQWRGPACST
jgi:PST family polysaccharide transporter